MGQAGLEHTYSPPPAWAALYKNHWHPYLRNEHLHTAPGGVGELDWMRCNTQHLAGLPTPSDKHLKYKRFGFPGGQWLECCASTAGA